MLNMRKFLALALLVLSFNLQAQNKGKSEGKGKIDFPYTSWDFGNVNEKGGPVFHEFKFINTGKSPVRIIDVKTSCGCTSTSWTQTSIAPGDTGSVNAVFEPDNRQGAFSKTLSVMSNGETELIDLTIKGVVYASRLSQTDIYKYRYGNLAVASNVINLPNVKNTGYDSTEIGFYNLSNKRVYFYKIEAPSNIQLVKTYDNVSPNTEYKIKMRYYPRRPVEFGPVKNEIKFYTNDDTLPVKIFEVNANIIEDFGVLDKKALKEAPKFAVNSNILDLGNVALFMSPSGVFTIKNKGKKDLILRRLIKNCTCIVPELSSREIKKGESATLKVTWNTVNMAGPDSKTIRLITNDPTQPEIILTIKVNVIE